MRRTQLRVFDYLLGEGLDEDVLSLVDQDTDPAQYDSMETDSPEESEEIN